MDPVMGEVISIAKHPNFNNVKGEVITIPDAEEVLDNIIEKTSKLSEFREKISAIIGEELFQEDDYTEFLEACLDHICYENAETYIQDLVDVYFNLDKTEINI